MIIRFAFAVLLVLSFAANSAVVEGLYSASVKIQNQSQQAQNSAMKSGFKQVLVKVSGNKALLSDPTIRGHIANADKFLLSFQFEVKQDAIFYQADFDPQAVEKIIRLAGFPIWGKRRPDALIWLAVQDPFSRERTLVAEQSQLPLVQQAQETASLRGIDISFPLMDLTDIQQLNVYDVWGSYTQNILLASERYQADFVLSARLFFRNSKDDLGSLETAAPLLPLKEQVWVAEYIILHKGAFTSGVIEADTKPEAMASLIDALADNESSLYAIDASALSKEEKQALIVVEGVDDLTKYNRLTTFLASLSVVVNATLVEQQGDAATFELELFGTKQDLLNALNLDDRIKLKVDQFDQVTDDFRFVWSMQ